MKNKNIGRPTADLSGKRFGNLLVISRIADSKKAKYVCQCDCGNITNSFSTYLEKKHRVLSCMECARKEYAKRQHKISNPDVIGKKFGKWTILSICERVKNSPEMVMCRCECGKERALPSYYVYSGRSTKCEECSHKCRPCRTCGCKDGHKNITDNCECDHLGVCPTCDLFDVYQIAIPTDLLTRRSRKIVLMRSLERRRRLKLKETEEGRSYYAPRIQETI